MGRSGIRSTTALWSFATRGFAAFRTGRGGICEESWIDLDNSRRHNVRMDLPTNTVDVGSTAARVAAESCIYRNINAWHVVWHVRDSIGKGLKHETQNLAL